MPLRTPPTCANYYLDTQTGQVVADHRRYPQAVGGSVRAGVRAESPNRPPTWPCCWRTRTCRTGKKRSSCRPTGWSRAMAAATSACPRESPPRAMTTWRILSLPWVTRTCRIACGPRSAGGEPFAASRTCCTPTPPSRIAGMPSRTAGWRSGSSSGWQRRASSPCPSSRLPQEEPKEPPPPPVRSRMLAEVSIFVRAASRLPGVLRIALIGSLATDKPDAQGRRPAGHRHATRPTWPRWPRWGAS